jgi:hypothetical protein
MDLARRPFLHTMASGKKRDAFNAQSLGVNLNPKVKEVRKLHPKSILKQPFQACLALEYWQISGTKLVRCSGLSAISSKGF